MINILDTASVGYPLVRHGIGLFPVYVHQLLDRTISVGGEDVTVTEVGGGEVPVLRVSNPLPVPVLLPEGETLIGGRQNRVLNVSVLVPAGSSTDVPVSCVEAGRWNEGECFDRANWKATRRVRRTMVDGVGQNLRQMNWKGADQGQVWSAIEQELHRFDADNPTAALHEVRGAGLAGPAAAATEELVSAGPLPQQNGLVMSRGSRIIGAEIFATPELLESSWESIVRSVMLEADDRYSRPSPTRALRFLHRLATGESHTANGVGLGQEVHVRTDRLVGQALVWDDVLVHASAFAIAA